MLVVTDWLEELLSKKLSLRQIEDALEQAGLEVDNIHQLPSYDEKIIVVVIEKIEPHPDADKLQLVTVKLPGQKVRVVCGAANIAVGQKVAYAPVGTKLPDSQVIEEATIRGISSPGMLLSERELGLSDNHSGLLLLAPDLRPGTKLKQIFKNSTTLDVKTAANRPDLNGLVGIAREVAAQTGATLKYRDNTRLQARPVTHFTNQIKSAVPRYALAKLKLPASLPPTPEFMKQRLLQSNIRPINLAVDITNYVMLETAQPLHAFDGRKVADGIIIRQAKPGESVTTLDGVSRRLAKEDLVIADRQKVIGIAGVMGSENSEITDQTREVWLEAANFDGARTRRTALRYGLRTEASARFERGLPLQFVAVGLNRALELYKQYAKAKVEWIEDELNAWPWVQHVGVRSDQFSRLAGFGITDNQVIKSLNRLGFTAEKFNIVDETKKHLGKPYKWGANFKQDGTSAFDCSYLVDYVYSLIDHYVGHTALGQFEHGRTVKEKDLKAGDVVFLSGKDTDAPNKYYFTRNHDGSYTKRDLKKPKFVVHNGIYIGNNQVVQAHGGQYIGKSQGVIKVPLSIFTDNPNYEGARRYLEDSNGWITVTAPYWRTDIKLPEDVFEEVIKLVGLDKVKSHLPGWQMTEFSYDAWPVFISSLRASLVGLGIDEVMVYPFTNQSQIGTLSLSAKNHIKIDNPLSAAGSHLASSLLSGLLPAVASNTQLADSINWFAIDKVFNTSKKAPTESNHLAVVGQAPDKAYQQIKNVLDNLARQLALDFKLKLATAPAPYWHPQRHAQVVIGDNQVGLIGELNPLLCRRLKIKSRVAYLELNIEELLKQSSPRKFQPIGKYQPIVRDVTYRLNPKVDWQTIKTALARLPAGVSTEYLNDYYDVKAGLRALTIRFKIEPTTAKSSEADAGPVLEQAAAILQRQFKARIA